MGGHSDALLLGNRWLCKHGSKKSRVEQRERAKTRLVTQYLQLPWSRWEGTQRKADSFFFPSFLHQHKMMRFFYEVLQMVKGTVALAQTGERRQRNLLLTMCDLLIYSTLIADKVWIMVTANLLIIFLIIQFRLWNKKKCPKKCPSEPKSQKICSLVVYDKEKNQIGTFEKLKPDYLWNFSCKMTAIINLSIAIFADTFFLSISKWINYQVVSALVWQMWNQSWCIFSWLSSPCWYKTLKWPFLSIINILLMTHLKGILDGFFRFTLGSHVFFIHD